ncbi:MAG: DUF460 domain-containing protein [Methanothermobacter sp.]|nr:DUF460 domain-containing protein [Methanothermobacter sp.]MDI9614246.1 DUF460 domain-containing protein [Methanothermobacter sp.]
MQQNKNPDRGAAKPLTIVGVDPGLTVGLAVLDLEGRLLYLGSMKEASRSSIIEEIIKHGKPIIVASDVYPPPGAVKRIASMLNAKLYTPEKVLTVSFKNELVSEFLRESENSPENSHERDALAAALRAYRHYEKKLRQIERKVEEAGLTAGETLEVKGLVIMGKPAAEAIRSLKELEEADKISSGPMEGGYEAESFEFSAEDEKSHGDVEKLRRTIRTQRSTIRHQRLTIEKLKREGRSLKERISKLEKEKSKLESKLERLQYEYSRDLLLNRELSHKLKVIEKLQRKYTKERERREALERDLDSLLQIKDMESLENTSPVKIIDSFTREGIRSACSRWKIKRGDVLLLRSSEGGGSQTARILMDLKPCAIITEDRMSHQALEVFEEAEVPVISRESLDIQIHDDFGSVKTQDLNREIKKWKHRLNEKRKKREEEDLLRVITEYRAQRRRNH